MYAELKRSIDQVRIEYARGNFAPLLEDDFLARPYFHLLKADYERICNRLFLKTRVLQNHRELASLKWDLVIGDLSTDASYVIPCLVCEFKFFSSSFSAQQRSKRRDHVLNDIDKLNKISFYHESPVDLCVCLFDEIGWLDGSNRNDKKSRLCRFINHKKNVNPRIKILGVSVDSNSHKAILFEH